MNRADQRGFITFDDVLEVLEEDGEDMTSLESILFQLDELGIELQKEGEDKDLDEENDIDYDDNDHESLQDPTTVGDITAIPSDDPVGLYFRQMAQEPLLTAQEEIDLA